MLNTTGSIRPTRDARNPFLFVHHGGQGYATFTYCTSHNNPPNYVRPDQLRGTYSFHPGGLHGSMVDGSGRFVSDRVTFSVWAATFTRANASFAPGESCWRYGGGDQTCDMVR